MVGVSNDMFFSISVHIDIAICHVGIHIFLVARACVSIVVLYCTIPCRSLVFTWTLPRVSLVLRPVVLFYKEGHSDEATIYSSPESRMVVQVELEEFEEDSFPGGEF